MLILLLLFVLVLAYWGALEYLRMQWHAIPESACAVPDDRCVVQENGQASVVSEWPASWHGNSLKDAAAENCCISLIVVVRNEALHLPHLFRALQAQSLSHQLFELHLVDDGSTDQSRALTEEFKKEASFKVHLHKLVMPVAGTSPKKAAIGQVLSFTRGSLIAVTDGDCVPEPYWLSCMHELWLKKASVFISGPVRYIGEQTLFEHLQALDFAALIGVGAAMLKAGRPGMCNAANMAFSKKAFFAVDGYRGNEHVPSGDDEFLLQKLSLRYPDKIHFLKSAGAIVSTEACSSWQQFMQQRKRWAGKWRLHKGIGPKLMAIIVFMFYLLLATVLLLPVFDPALTPYIALALCLKGVADYRFLRPIFHFLKKPLFLKVFLLLELVYPFYVLFFAVAANVGSFTWKERSYRYSKSAHERTGISSTG